MSMLDRLSTKNLIITAAVASAGILGGAFVFQALGYAPCKMCFWQRWPHAIAVILGGAALATKMRLLRWVGAVTMAVSAGLGIFHSGVERKWWDGPASCSGGGVGNLSVEDLMAQIKAAPLVRCDEIPWRLSDMIPIDALDITMANFNAIGSLALMVMWIVAARRPD
ncbi:Disulfide bond formation protein DsbB [Aliiroseovarius halocynthiae]|nr:disulfide bond formation protein B [Aliiroseovarius halocynthiae]SMR71905.1 Disulfide bond formation protein DsbB [Aliiroseovarius halocynthiae]